LDGAAGSGKVVPDMPNERKNDRYAIRPDGVGFTVYVIFTGEPAIVGGAPQTRMSEADARHMVDLLNTQARRGDSSMRRS
jgi:hypothetical protein